MNIICNFRNTHKYLIVWYKIIIKLATHVKIYFCKYSQTIEILAG